MSIAERLAQVREQIASAAVEAGRDPRTVELVAVTKTRSAAEVAEAIRAGATQLGENYVQEARRKIDEVAALLPDHGARWHLIGPLQSNKAKGVAGAFHAVESLDRVELVEALARRLDAATAPLEVLVQVNIGREPQKSGCDPDAIETVLDAIARHAVLAVQGLMAIPPESEDPESARRYFRALAGAARRLADHGRLPDPPVLSMGMSHDFRVAIAEGATRVRIGTAIFGPRPPRPG